MAFVNLHNHSGFSFLDGISTPEEIANRAKELGQTAVALTDHGNIHGAVEFTKACLEAGVKPIIGVESYFTDDIREKKGKRIEGTNGKHYYHLILLAKNRQGYRNLCKLITLSNTKGFYYKPRIDYRLLEEYHEGLIALSGCLGGYIPYILTDESKSPEERYKEAKEVALKHKSIFKDDYYLEVQDHGIKEDKIVIKGLEKLSKDLGIKIVATNDGHYTKKEDWLTHDLMLAIQTRSQFKDKDRFKFEGEHEYYFKSEEEMLKLFKPEYIENTVEVANKCNFVMRLHHDKMPTFNKVPKKFMQEQKRLHPNKPTKYYHRAYLVDIAKQKLNRIYNGKVPQEAIDRFNKELAVLYEKDYIDYFLIVWDYINYAHKQGIITGPSRGSAGGSFIAYLLDITALNPLEYNLYFERFLNPERESAPDIDTDFEDERRDEMKTYLKKTYGAENTANVGAIGRMQGKMAFKDVGRALGIPYDKLNKTTKLFPKGTSVSLKEAYESEDSPGFRKAVDKDKALKTAYDFAVKLEGLPRQPSTHASGFIISPEPITNYDAMFVNNGELVSQADMDAIHDIGLIKMDLLGLNTLTIMKDTVNSIRKHKKPNFDLNKIPLDDTKVYQMLAKGDTKMVFQFESAGMTQFLKALAPENLDDLIAAVALYRPGPMDFIEDFIANKHDDNHYKSPYKNEFLRKTVDEITKETYHIFLYQEQLMRVFQEVAGFSMGRADILRRAMSKKDQALLDKEFRIFIEGETDEKGNVIIEGTRRKDIPDEEAKLLLDNLKGFANYGFNKSHAAAYAYLAYQTAYLKKEYPAEFAAANLTSAANKTAKPYEREPLAVYLNNVKNKMHLKVDPPYINEAEAKFIVNKGDHIVFSLPAIKGIGMNTIEPILEERESNGKFKSLEDFIKRVDISEGNIELLIRAGSFDRLIKNRNRQEALSLSKTLININKYYRRHEDRKQRKIFSTETLSALISYKLGAHKLKKNIEEDAFYEHKLLNSYIATDPLDKAKDELIKYPGILDVSTTINNIIYNVDGFDENNVVLVVAIPHEFSMFYTKNNTIMGTGILEDKDSIVDFAVFHYVLNNEDNKDRSLEIQSALKQSVEPVLVRGLISYYQDKPQIVIIDAAKVSMLNEDILIKRFKIKEANEKRERIDMKQEQISQGEDPLKPKGLYLNGNIILNKVEKEEAKHNPKIKEEDKFEFELKPQYKPLFNTIYKSAGMRGVYVHVDNKVFKIDTAVSKTKKLCEALAQEDKNIYYWQD